ncbi:MAG: transcriptional repressor LexA [Caldiserica bacterium]|jgi:repressor LexA|nr:transcriptional repressor LexA [Caldisericota bacterium]MDH7562865.1 transcriptional repressor LexA [Caldisericota bacterium]
MEKLTEIQQRILQFLTQRISRGQGVPSVREICNAVGLKSTSSVHAQLSMLEKKGYIRRTPFKSRSIEVVGVSNSVFRVPLVGKVRAGEPNLAQEEWIGFFPLPEVFKGLDCFVLNVKGDSMVEAGIFEGDYVVVRRQQQAENGDIVVALIDDEATIKRFKKSPKGVILEPANPKYSPIVAPDCLILGKVIGLFRIL